MKLSKLLGRSGGGKLESATEKNAPNDLSGKGRGRFIHIYNPTKELKTADSSITRALDETYNMKDNITEESVMDYFNDVLRNFDDDDTKSIKNEVVIPSADVEKIPVQKEEQKFYFQKINDSSALKKIHQITYFPSQTPNRPVHKKNPTNSTKNLINNSTNNLTNHSTIRTPVITGANSQVHPSSKPSSSQRVPRPFSGTLEVTVQKSSHKTTTSPEKSQAQKEAKNLSTMERSQKAKSRDISSQKKQEKTCQGQEVRKSTTLDSSNGRREVNVHRQTQDQQKHNKKQQKHNKKQPSSVSSSVVTVSSSFESRHSNGYSPNSAQISVKNSEQSICSATSIHSSLSAHSASSNDCDKSRSTGRDSVRSYDITVHSTGSYEVNRTIINEMPTNKHGPAKTVTTLERKPKKEITLPSGRNIREHSHQPVIHSADVKPVKAKRQSRFIQNEYKIEIYKSEAVPGTL